MLRLCGRTTSPLMSQVASPRRAVPPCLCHPPDAASSCAARRPRDGPRQATIAQATPIDAKARPALRSNGVRTPFAKSFVDAAQPSALLPALMFVRCGDRARPASGQCAGACGPAKMQQWEGFRATECIPRSRSCVKHRASSKTAHSQPTGASQVLGNTSKCLRARDLNKIGRLSHLASLPGAHTR